MHQIASHVNNNKRELNEQISIGRKERWGGPQTVGKRGFNAIATVIWRIIEGPGAKAYQRENS